MDAFSIARHLDREHRVEDAHLLAADEANEIHHGLHAERHQVHDHSHFWSGQIADPQGAPA